ncbi:hypothetical protein BDW71DRAFT_189521 [Aspergillus fruticulosus]
MVPAFALLFGLGRLSHIFISIPQHSPFFGRRPSFFSLFPCPFLSIIYCSLAYNKRARSWGGSGFSFSRSQHWDVGESPALAAGKTAKWK